MHTKSLRSKKNILCLFFLLSLVSCYQIEKSSGKHSIYIPIFENKTFIYGLQNELAAEMPKALRNSFHLEQNQNKESSPFIIQGKLVDYKKAIIRRDSNGEPTHQQIQITCEISFGHREDSIIYWQETPYQVKNTDFRLDSGEYSLKSGISESYGKQAALQDLAQQIIKTIEYQVKDNK